MRIKSGILNFSTIVGIVLVTVSLWGDKINKIDNAEIQNPALITEVADGFDDSPIEVIKTHDVISSKINYKHINYSFRNEYRRIEVK